MSKPAKQGSKFDAVFGALDGADAEPHADPRAGGPGTRGGRRGDPAFTQVSAYISKDTYREVKRRLIDDGRDFSELVDDLLRGYVSTRVDE